MPIKLTTKQFIEKSLDIYGNNYDYSEVNYINSSTKVEIICAEHGSFYKTPNKHLASKQGCPNCSKNYKWNFNKVSVKLKNIYTNLKVIDFCNKSRKVLVEENGIKHEIFLQSALKGTKLSIQTALDKTKFIIPILTKLHSNKYSYENLIYKNSLEKVIITCKVHGDFIQSVYVQPLLFSFAHFGQPFLSL